MLQCLGMCVYMLLQVYVRVSRYVFGYVVTGLCYSVGRYVFGYVVTGLC